MTMLYVATDAGLAIISRRDGGAGHADHGGLGGHEGGWHAAWTLAGKQAQCVAVDPRRPERVYCGTFDAGLWRSHDAGRTWLPGGVNGGHGAGSTGIPHPSVMALAVSPDGTVWAGTEPSAIFVSDDGGQRWREEPALRDLPSAPTWSFPPRPYTSHVRWIQLDPGDPRRVLASIEAGGVMTSEDGGVTWHDRQPDTPRDAHGLAMHPDAPARVSAASGDAGYAESTDGGRTWRRHNDGLSHPYLWAVAVDARDAATVVVSGSPGAYHAHRREHAESALFRKYGDGRWEQVSDGLPPAVGTMTYALAAAGDGVYAAPHEGDLYRSADGGRTWGALHVDWRQPDQLRRPPYVHAIVAAG